MNNVIKVNREKTLPDQRYDEKLFKQAYKAAVEGKKLEERNKRRKVVRKISILVLSPVLVTMFLLFLFSFRKERLEYIEPEVLPLHSVLYRWEESDTYPMYLDISLSSVSAESVLVFNTNSGSILFEKDADERRSIASITKLLAVMVVLDSYKLDESIEVSLENIPENLEWTLELQEGDMVKVDVLLKAMLISSYNDSAYIVANAYPNGGYKGFISAMNNKAKVLRMNNSRFSNPAGLDDEKSYSTARDVSRLVSATVNYEYIMDIVKRGSAVLSWSSNGELKNKTVYTTNQLYGKNQYIKGMKTGVTKQAGQCFVGFFEYTNGLKLVTVVLGSEDRFTDTTNLERLSRSILR